MKKTTVLRKLLERPKATLLAGVHDGISSRLAERAGFNGVWSSGFCISASKGMPDVGLLTMSEHLAASIDINKCSTLPVVADVDNGYGDAINVTRVVREYESAGIAGICLEDYRHPKRCSLITGFRRNLETIAEFTAKIAVAKESQTDPDFVVIARTEALVAEQGICEALERAAAYAEAGADLVLVQSQKSTPDEIKSFAAQWNEAVPLVAVPTMYPGVTVAELYEAGYSVIILANHGFRAAVLAMAEVFERLITAQTISAVDERIAPLSEIFSLVGYDEIRELEQRFLARSGAASAASVKEA